MIISQWLIYEIEQACAAFSRRLLSGEFSLLSTDPFAEANAEDSGAGSKEYVHIRTQQRNGRKSLTTVQGLKKEFSYNKILKDLKKEFCCNGTVVQDPELGQVSKHALYQKPLECSFLSFNLTFRRLTPQNICNELRLSNFKGISGRMSLLSLFRYFSYITFVVQTIPVACVWVLDFREIYGVR